MARLSKKQTVRVSFLLHKMALTYGQQQREEILSDLLDALHIDAEQGEDSRKSAAHHIRYEANRKRKNEQAAKQAGDIDNMSHEDLQAYIKQLYAKRDELLAQRAKRPDIDAMSDEERAAYQAHLMHSIAAKLAPAPASEPAPVVSEADAYNLPTKRMEQAVARFDDLTDSDQVDQLRQMWA